jgi:hypothetical protein
VELCGMRRVEQRVEVLERSLLVTASNLDVPE